MYSVLPDASPIRKLIPVYLALSVYYTTAPGTMAFDIVVNCKTGAFCRVASRHSLVLL